MTDTERLDWLEKREGLGLISDDFGHWAVSAVGFQNIPEEWTGDNPGPGDINSTFFVEKEDWCKSIREAIDIAVDKEKAEEFEER